LPFYSILVYNAIVGGNRNGWLIIKEKKEKFAFGLKYSVDIICTRSEIKKNEFFISLARLIIKFEPIFFTGSLAVF